MTVRVMLAEDHEIVRSGLRKLMEGTSDLRVAAEAASGPETLELLRTRTDVDVVVLDLGLPQDGGVELVRQVRSVEKAPPVVVFTGYPEEQFAIPCLRAGAAGYVSKSRPTRDLFKAIRTVAEGGRWVSADVGEAVLRMLGKEAPARPHLTLSAREFEVFRRLARGERVVDIAEALGLSVKTVSTYRSRILEKMEMASNADMVRYAVREGLLPVQ